MTVAEYSKRFQSLAKQNKANNVSRHIIDADCEYADGVFSFSALPSKLPLLFTARFTAPADFSAGDVFLIKGQEYAVKTSTMEEPDGKLFSADAVVQCDVDVERELLFFSRSGGEGEQEGCGCAFQEGDLTYFIDPAGDDSPHNPGGADSPFKTLAGAGNAAWRRIIMNPLGGLAFSFNPGTYDLTPAEQLIMTRASHPRDILFKASDNNNKPLLRADNFNTGWGTYRDFRGLRLQCVQTTSEHAFSPHHGGVTILRDSELIVSRPGGHVIAPHCGGTMRIFGTLNVRGNNHSVRAILHCHAGVLWTHSAQIMIENIQSTTDGTVFCANGNIVFSGTGNTFSGIVSGKRYHACHNGVINSSGKGANFIPGTTAGTTATGGLYV